MLKAVKKLEPGHALRIHRRRIVKQWSFYDLPFDQEFVDWPAEDAIVQVRKYMTRAVERQLVSDVPVGAFLSGGLDSSSVVALAQRTMGNDKLQCFTIGFKDETAQIEGMAADLPYAYLGYWIRDAPKMAYKSRFRPLEALGPDGWRIVRD